MKTKTFVVEGSRAGFPVDMLRYDSCWPATSADARMIEKLLDPEAREALPKRVQVQLQTDDRNFNVPTDARWASFLWKVVG